MTIHVTTQLFRNSASRLSPASRRHLGREMNLSRHLEIRQRTAAGGHYRGMQIFGAASTAGR